MFKADDVALLMALPGESGGLFEAAGIRVHYTGVGKVNAALTAMDVIHSRGCKVMLNLGSAGSSRFRTHELVEVTRFVQRDMDVSPLGFAVGETPHDAWPGALDLRPSCADLPKGCCGTGDSFETATPRVACDLVDMEGYALAKVCQIKGVRLVSLKYITDGADGAAHRDWQANLQAAAENLLDYYHQLVGPNA